MEVPRGEAILDRLYRVEGRDCCLSVEFEGYYGGFVHDDDDGDGDVCFWIGRVRPFGTRVRVGGQALAIKEIEDVG